MKSFNKITEIGKKFVYFINQNTGKNAHSGE